MYLPLTADGLPETDTVHGSRTGPRGQGELVLVVEDNTDLRALAVATISGLGYRTLEASHAAAALEHLDQAHDIDLLFTDVILPGGMTGVDLGEAALVRQPKIRILYTSGYTENAAAHNNITQSGEALLPKPYRREILAERLRSALTENEAVGF
jgi:CheY-like chemotaxis protein